MSSLRVFRASVLFLVCVPFAAFGQANYPVTPPLCYAGEFFAPSASDPTPEVLLFQSDPVDQAISSIVLTSSVNATVSGIPQPQYGESASVRMEPVNASQPAGIAVRVTNGSGSMPVTNCGTTLPIPGQWSNLGLLSGTGKLALASNSNGALEVFGTGAGNALFNDEQTPPSDGAPAYPSIASDPWGWSDTEIQTGYLAGNPAAAANSNGVLQVFARGGDNAVWTIQQQTVNSGGAHAYQGWTSLGGAILFDPAVGVNSDGRLEVFVIGTDKTLWHIAQTAPSGSWGSWSGLGGSLDGTPVVATNLDGRLEVFARGTDNALWHIWQTAPGGPYSGWTSLGGVIISNPAVAQNVDGQLQAFAVGTDNALWYNTQSAAGSAIWDGWNTLGGYVLSDPAAGVNSDGRLDVVVRGGDSTVWHNSQSQAGSSTWSGWSGLGGQSLDAPAVAANSDGRLAIFTRTNSGGAELSQTSVGSWQ